MVRRFGHRGLRRPPELVSLRYSHQTVQAPGKCTRWKADVKLFDLPKSPRGEMPAGRNPEQGEKEGVGA